MIISIWVESEKITSALDLHKEIWHTKSFSKANLAQDEWGLEIDQQRPAKDTNRLKDSL